MKSSFFVVCKNITIRFLFLLLCLIAFPVVLVSLIFATYIIPIVFVCDCFRFLFTGSFKFTDIYILQYYEKIGFGWFYILILSL